MTNADIVDLYNDILESQERLLAEWDKIVIEEPLGEKQIDYHENSDQWVPRGDVLRCIIRESKGRNPKAQAAEALTSQRAMRQAGPYTPLPPLEDDRSSGTLSVESPDEPEGNKSRLGDATVILVTASFVEP